MLARVTNLSRGPRGFLTLDRGTVMVEPGGSGLLDLADHPAHDAWVKAGDTSISPEPDDLESQSRPLTPARGVARGAVKLRG